ASDGDANRAAVALSRKLRAMPHAGILDAIPAARTVCVLFDPSRLSRKRLSRQIARAARGSSEEDRTRRLFRLPVVYDAEDLFDPDAGRPALLSPGDLVRFEPVPALSAPERVEPERPGWEEKPVFRVSSPGLFTTIQGLPRHGLASFGVPAGGAMDPASLAVA